MADQGPDAIDCTAAQGWDGIAAALARAAVRAGAAPGAGSALTLAGGAGAAVEGLAIEVEAGLHPEPAPEWGDEALILLADCTGVRVTGCTLSGGGDHLRGVLARRTPSLFASLRDPDRWADAWDEVLDQATRETGLRDLPRVCPWGAEQVLADDWLPGD